MGGTPKEEIDRQHREAVRLVGHARTCGALKTRPGGGGNSSGCPCGGGCDDDGDGDVPTMPCAPMVDRGEIPLSHKARPTNSDDRHASLYRAGGGDETNGRCRRDGGDIDVATAGKENGGDVLADGGGGDGIGGRDGRARRWCISSRGTVDVSSLAGLVDEGHNDAFASAVGGRTTKCPSSPNKGGGKQKRAAVAKFSPRNLWDPANARTNNVDVVRPSHDAWGIKKIVLVFCDDFLRDVYEMPWWWRRRRGRDCADDVSGGGGNSSGGMVDDGAMREAVRPILDVLGVPPRRIVRMLMAALPPGVTIPVHHDTGEWVRHTHRVHVPVIVDDPDLVLFRCGPTDDDMERVCVRPGHVFEMNNQARHAVSNCQPTDHRVHLILDYVDESFLPNIRRRVQLQPGERLFQTRRSIDRAVESGTRPAPSYLILGAQKCGTTSLYEWLNRHPLVVRAKRRETHCLDWRWDEAAQMAEERRGHCQKFFHARELERHPSCLTGDSTPSYLLHSDLVIPRLREVFPWQVKLFVVLRDPVARVHSHYRMVTDEEGTPEQKVHRGTDWLDKSFEEVVAEDVRRMREVGLIPYWTEDDGGSVDRDAFENFVGSDDERRAFSLYQSRYVPMGRGSHSPVVRGMYALQLRPWLDSFPRGDLLVLKLEDMTAESSNPDGCGGEGPAGGGGGGGDRTPQQSAYDRALAHLDLPPYELPAEATEPKNARSYDAMRDETKELLRRFYEPHNRLLRRLLGGGGVGGDEDWNEPWNYR